MISKLVRPLNPPAPIWKISRPSGLRRFLSTGSYNLFIWVLLLIYLLPIVYMVVLAFKSDAQLEDSHAPWYPAQLITFQYQGKNWPIYTVPIDGGTKQLAMVGNTTLSDPFVEGGSDITRKFVDPLHPEAGLIVWTGQGTSLSGVYRFSPAWSNFKWLFTTYPLPKMIGDTLFLVMLCEIGVLFSSILVGYGFSRFPLPGGDLLFYVLIATILVPEKVTLIPTFYIYVNFFHWHGTLYPLFVHLFFGNAVFIFLLRQNFKSLPLDLEEAAMLDGAGTLRTLFSVVLPQSWPAIVTISLLQFFYTWNETRLISLYMGSNSAFVPISYAVQQYSSSRPIQNTIEGANMVMLIVPVIVLLLSQRFFMRSMVITGMEKR